MLFIYSTINKSTYLYTLIVKYKYIFLWNIQHPLIQEQIHFSNPPNVDGANGLVVTSVCFKLTLEQYNGTVLAP